MTELERALLALGDELAFPEGPDVSGVVARRLAAESAPRARQRRRTLAIALAVVAVAVAAAFAVPPARTAILELFGLRGATVQRVDTLPTVPAPTARVLDLGRPVPIGEDGRPAVTIPEVLVPAELGPPDAAYSSAESYGRRLSLVYEPGPGVPESPYTGVGILVTEFVGEPFPGYVDKMAGGGTRVERVQVGPHRGIWLEGGPHVVMFRGDGGEIFEEQGRLAGNTLLVERDDVLVRIEGQLSRERAIEIARSLR